MVGRRGDTFAGKGKGMRSIPINPEEPSRADRFEFILRAMTGIDHLGEQINLHIYSQTLGLLEDVTADAAAIASDPKTKSSVIALNKAILLQSVAIKAAIDLVKSAVEAVESAVIDVESKIDLTNLKLDDANITLNEIATHLSNLLTDLATLQTSVDNLNTKADEIKAILERNAAPETINAPGPQSISVTGQLAWLSWETPGSTGTVVTVNDGTGNVYTSLKTDGFISFNPPMPDLIYSISVVPTGGTATVINAGAI